MTDHAIAMTNNGEIRPLAELEQEILFAAIALCAGNMTKAAIKLRIGRSTLYRKTTPLAVSMERTPLAAHGTLTDEPQKVKP